MYEQFDNVYNKIAKIGQGSYGQVYLCQKKNNNHFEPHPVNNESNQNIQPNIIMTAQNQQLKSKTEHHYYAVKKLKHLCNPKKQNESQQTHFQECRQVLVMRALNHQNILRIQDIVQKVKGQRINHYLVLEYGVQLIQFAKHKELSLSKYILKSIIKQLVDGLTQIHKHNFIHRDFKPDNIFLTTAGVIKIGDFSLSRKLPQHHKSQSQSQGAMINETQGAMINEIQQQNQGKMTGNVTTRYYRAPQIIFGNKHYSKSIDIWSLGCTLAQIILHEPLFPGQSDINQLQKIFSVVGYPQDHWPGAQQLPYYFQFNNQTKEKGLQNILPDCDYNLVDLIRGCLRLDPQKRLSIEEVKTHPYFIDCLSENEQLQKICLYLNQKKIKGVVSKVF